MKTVFLKSLSDVAGLKKLVQRPAVRLETLFPKVRKILLDVKKRGDAAVREYTKKFDRVDLDNFQKTKTVSTWADRPKLKQTQGLEKVLRIAAENIEKFHRSQLLKEKPVETVKGIKCWREWRAIEKVGLYVPKGLVSTVLMLGIPARIAGCKEIIMCTSPDSPPHQRGANFVNSDAKGTLPPLWCGGKQGRIAQEMLLAAEIAGITKVFKIGGAQAIAAMAYGTETVPKVDKIFGPGNQYVMAAKMLVSIDPEGAAIDLPAGPSEVLVIADSQANPSFVAADLLSQAEHGADSQVVLTTNAQDLVRKVKSALKRQLLDLPATRRKLAESTLENSRCIITKTIDKAIAFANHYAPEHLILNLKNPEKYISQIKNAGSVFVGEYTPESVGDYASGTNHVLPTSGYARSYSGVSIDGFIKKITFQKITKTGLQNIAPTVKALADIEQMPAHKNAVVVRTIK